MFHLISRTFFMALMAVSLVVTLGTNSARAVDPEEILKDPGLEDRICYISEGPP